jgi:hypothetical protein
MKKLLLAAVFTLAAFAAKAQTVTQANLQGKWSMVSMDSEGVLINLEKKTFTISQEIKDEMGGDTSMVEKQLQQMLDSNMKLFIEFKGAEAIFIQEMDGQAQSDPATYVLKDGTPQILETTTADGVKDANEIVLKDGILEITAQDDGTKLVLKKA